MKQYLIDNRPRVTLVLILILFVTTLITTFFHQLTELLLLYPENVSQPSNWYRLLTYPFCVGGLANWFHNSLMLLLAGYLFENKVSKATLLRLILVSALIGGLMYVLLNQQDRYNLPIGGPSMISWGYAVAASIFGFKSWKSLVVFEKVALFYSAFSFTGLFYANNTGILLGQIVILLLIFIYIVGFKKVSIQAVAT